MVGAGVPSVSPSVSSSVSSGQVTSTWKVSTAGVMPVFAGSVILNIQIRPD